MKHRRFPQLVLAIVVIASLTLGAAGSGFAAEPLPMQPRSAFEGEASFEGLMQDAPTPPIPEKWAQKYQTVKEKQERRITTADRLAAAERAAAGGFKLAEKDTTGVQAAAAGQAPRYFSHPNYANSPLPVIYDTTVAITDGGGTGTGATATATVVAGVVTTITLTSPGSGYAAPVVSIAGSGTGAAASATADPTTGAITGITVDSGGSGYGAVTAGTGIRKFLDALPQLCDPSQGPCTGTPTLDQYIPLGVADKTSYAGADYYEIAVVQYREQMHSNLTPTLLRGYVQLQDCAAGGVPLKNAMLDGTEVDTGYCGVTEPHYLGPTLISAKDTPVRILFRNLLPAGAGGDLFVPTDVTVMGAGMGPDLQGMPEVDPQNPMCEETPKPAGCFTENRAVLHLHGGLNPWISDGTPHQWITPAGETLPYPDEDLGPDKENKGVSVAYVPDMWFDANGVTIASCAGQTTCDVPGATNNPGKGAQTYYYTNQQSARLMFYHDHSWGITRLGVYIGGAAGYLIQDDAEAALTGQGGALEGLGTGIPLIIQDKTFVPSPEQLAISDETWDTARWGGLGNLWLPHVYSPAQNPGDASGVNQFGRWAYGPWFWPPVNNISYGPTANPYYDPNCDPDAQWCEPPLMPATPYNSMGMEAFHDTPVVNGTAYPTLELAPGEYRFRILNAASDRFFNLSLYQADPAQPTEVQLNPAEVAAALQDPTIFPTPVITSAGPSWVQIATEGGFLPAPVVIDPQPITWVNDPTVFNAGNVDGHALLLGPAERADVVVDLAPFAGQTLILYNDAPAAFPARDPRYDYYTGNGDYRDIGGAPSTLPGYGPNTRTVMQIKVTGTAGTPAPNHVNADRLARLQAAFAHHLDANGNPAGVFESSQNPIIVGQGEYNSTYGTNFQTNGSMNGTGQIYDKSLTFNTLPQPGSTELGTLTMAFQPKQIQDEQGEAFDRDYGRMSGFLGLESPNPAGGGVQNMILYPFVNPVSELIDATNLPKSNVAVTPIATASDGSQIWKITHNGVDTHPIHFHLFDVQVLNRVGWDGIIRKPDANELGWKDTVRISPLEDTIVALRPIVPVVPWEVPNSVRPLNPAMPTGSTLMFTNMDANGDPTVPIVNEWTNFGWEYVWHCHILSHEEMDMMRPISVSAPPKAPANLAGTRSGSGRNRQDNLTWQDVSGNETGFLVRRAPTATGPWTDLATLPAGETSYASQPPTASPYFYQVIALNKVGYDFTAGYSTVTTSGASAAIMVPEGAAPAVPAAPTGMVATAEPGPQVRLTWRDNATNETGFVIQRAVVTNGVPGTFADLVTVGPRNSTGGVAYTDVAVEPGNTYVYQVAAANAGGTSAFTTSNQVTIVAAPPAPLNVQATAVRQGTKAKITLNWIDALGSNETGFTIQMATNQGFTANLVTVNVGMNVHTYSTGLVARNTPYYLRIRAFNAAGVSNWVNAAPFPIRTP